MKIVVIGGSGLIGANVVGRLRRIGQEVMAASPASGVNSVTGEGLAEALAGAQVVVDVANSPSFEDKAALEFFEKAGHNLMPAEKAAGVRHHLALSVVGTERTPEIGYFRAKMAQEKLIKASGLPYTILHATQFFEFINGIVETGAEGDVIRLSPALLQPIASDDVAALLAQLAVGPPLNATIEVAGPEACPSKLARKLMAARGDTRQVVADVHRPLLRRGAERSNPYPRPEPAYRPDALRGLARPDGAAAPDGVAGSGPRSKEMIDPCSARLLARYRRWADERIYDAVAQLPPGEATKDRPTPLKSIIGTLNHSYAMDLVWQAHLEGRDHGIEARDVVLHEELPELRRAQRAISQWYIDWGDGQTAPSLDETVRFRFIDGASGAMTRGDILLHVVNHATYHRGWIAQMLFQVPARSPSTDLPVYLGTLGLGPPDPG